MEVGLRDYVDGAALVTDLVLTIGGHRLGDRMTTATELAALLDDHGLRHGPLTATDLDGARALRDELVALFHLGDDAAVVAGASAVLAGCRHRLRAGPGHATARHGDWRVAAPPDASPVERLRLVAGAGLLATVAALGAGRLRGCSSDSCTGMFVDTSNTGRRRFCTPRICGNRVNVARYRARRTRG